MNAPTDDLREALEIIRAYVPKTRGGHSALCCNSNGGCASTKPIHPDKCLCAPRQQRAIALLKKHGLRI